MTKADLVEQVAGVIGQRVTKRDCGLVADAFLDAVQDTLARGDHIEIRGFGTFKVRHRKARTARNPRTGETVEVPPRVAPVFKPSIHFRSRIGPWNPGRRQDREQRRLQRSVVQPLRQRPREARRGRPPPCSRSPCC